MKPKVAELIGDNTPLDEKKMDILNSKDHVKDNFLPCAQPWASVHINNDGNVFPCLAVPIGNVRDKSIKEIIFDAEFKSLKAFLKNSGLLRHATDAIGYSQLSKFLTK